MSTPADRAREEVERIAREIKQTAQDAKISVQSTANDLRKMTSTTRTSDFAFANVVNQLRIAQLVALTLQGLTLFMEADRIGLSGFLLPFVFIAVNLFLSGKRWYNEIDGRYDAQQLISVADASLKSQYALALFGAFLLSLLVHAFTPIIPSGMVSLIYHLSDYTVIAVSFVIVALEIFEGLRTKFR